MFAEVIVDVSNNEVDRVFDYIVPQNLKVQKGAKVVVPFGPRKITGYVIDLKEQTSVETHQLKELASISNDGIVLKPEVLDLCFYLKQNFYLKMIDCINACVPSVVRSGKVKPKINVFASLNGDQEVVENYLTTLRKNAKNQVLLVQYLTSKDKENVVTLNAMFGATNVKKLIENNIIITNHDQQFRNPLQNFDKQSEQNIVLTDMQTSAINTIVNSKGKTVLLHGVTGSGKTEIYLQVIKQILNAGKTAIMLVPEISLTPQMVSRFRERFLDSVAVLHSGLSDGEKYDEWNRINDGKAKVVVGARSAIFSPLTNVGVIIIDEEHDSSYISESNPRYNTLDVAEYRSRYNSCPLILGTATPNIESYYKAKQGQYVLVELPTRVNNLSLPPITIVDMLPEFRSGNTSVFSSVLLNELDNVIKNNKQAILFINRRGFASFLMCRQCGFVPKCTDCDVSLTYHKGDNELKCHFCGKRYKAINVCPTCQSHDIRLGGVGTERVVNELKQHFGGVNIFRMDNDTTSVKDAYSKILSAFEKSTPAILVGTQMIAKGHDFPLVTLVGILDADLSLYFGEHRANERTFQLITQVSGRAGRKHDSGKVILQTYYPKNHVYKLVANYDYKMFYEKEINLRQVTNFPPFSTVVRVLVSSDNDEQAKAATHNAYMAYKELKALYSSDILFLEAMRSPVGRIKNKYRYQIVVRFKQNENILKQIYEVCDTIKTKNIQCFVELNPQNLS